MRQLVLLPSVTYLLSKQSIASTPPHESHVTMVTIKV